MWSDFLVSNKLEDFTLQTIIWWKNNYMFFHNLSFIFFYRLWLQYNRNTLNFILIITSAISEFRCIHVTSDDCDVRFSRRSSLDSRHLILIESNCNVIFWHTWTDKFYGLLRLYKGMWWVFFRIWKCKINVYCHFNITWSYL